MKPAMGFGIGLLVVVLLGAFGCQAPTDYYLEFAKMERLGEKLRAQRPSEPQQPVLPEVTLAFEPGETPSRLLRLDVKRPQTEILPETSQTLFRARVPIAINVEALRRTLEQRGIAVTGVRNVDGRLKGEANVIRISFVPQAFSDEMIYETYLILLAVVRGTDTREGTVDRVIGIAEDASANPRMILEGRMEDYIDYVERRVLSQQEWLHRVSVRRF